MPAEQVIAKIAPKFHFNRALPKGSWNSDLCLWQLPEFMRQIWWARAEESLKDESVNKGFYRHVRQFLAFKDYPGSEQAAFSVEVLDSEHPDLPLAGKSGVANLGDGRITILVKLDGLESELSLNPGYAVAVPAGAELLSRSTPGETEAEILLTYSLSGGAG